MAARPKYFWEPTKTTGGHVYEAFGGLPLPGAFAKVSGLASATAVANGNQNFFSSADAATGQNFFEINNPAGDINNFRLYARVKGITRGANTWGIYVRNSGNTKSYASVRLDNGTTQYLQNTAFAGGVAGGSLTNPDYYGWMMIELVGGAGGNINFYESADGYNWLLAFSQTVAAFLGASPDKVGVTWFQGTTLLQSGLWLSSFGVTVPV